MRSRRLLTAAFVISFDRTTLPRRSLCSILALGLFLSGSVAPASEPVTFEQSELVIGSEERQTLLTGFLLGGAVADLAAVSIDENGGRHLRIYEFGDGTWAPRHDATLRPGVLFVDVANIGGRDRLVTYENDRLNWFDPESATEQMLVAVTSSFNPPRRREIPHVDITRDLNDDDRDDLVVPDIGGFQVFIQMSDGTFADPVEIGPPTDLSRIYGADGYRYEPWSQSRVHEVDYDQDGRSDLVFWNEDHFEVHQQDERGLFAAVAETFTTDVAFDSDDLSSIATGDMTGRVLHSLTDLNGDGVSDLVVFALEGSSISSKHSTYEVHFGERAPDGGTVFARDAGLVFQSHGKPIVFQNPFVKGDYRQWVVRAQPQVPQVPPTDSPPAWPYVQLGMERHDFDGDGQLDLMFTTIEANFLTSSFLKRWRAFWGDSIWLNHEFYRMDGGRYPTSPNAIRRLALVGGPSSPGWVPLGLVLRGGKHESLKTEVRTIALEGGGAAAVEDWRRLSEVSSKSYPPAFNKTVLVGDVTGDGRSDLLIVDHPRILNVFAGVSEPHLFARQPQEVAVTVPLDEEYIWLVDLNKDGKQDILMHDPFPQRDAHGTPTQPPGIDPHRVTILIAR